MPLSDALLQDIQDARAHSMPPLRATAPALEALLYTPFPCLDHGFVRVVDYMGDDDAVVQSARVSYGRGTKASRHCTYHGVALNVAMDLEPFARINPCGYAGLQTVDLSTIGVHTTWEEAAQVLGQQLSIRLAP